MKKAIFRACVQLTNHQLSSSVLKLFSSSKISKPFVVPFATTFKLNQAEMAKPLSEYPSLHELFVRNLREGSRAVDKDPASLVSPVDGIIAESGKLKDSTLFEVKGQQYNIVEMLGSLEKAMPYYNGYYFIIYLSPSHYHRIHSPIDGMISSQWTLGGRSYPVNAMGLKYGKRPLSRNYRVVTEIDVNGKHLSVVKVGAMNINTIQVTHSEKQIKKGEELAYFSFGSTIVLLLEEGLMESVDRFSTQEVRMGEQIGKITNKGTDQ